MRGYREPVIGSSDWRTAAKVIEADKQEYRALYQHVPLPLCPCTPDNMHHSESPAYYKGCPNDCRDVLMYICIPALFYPLL